MDRITAELLLGLKSPYNEEDVSAAYKRTIRENHPDVLIAKGYSPEDANERAKQINTARDYLLSSLGWSGSYSQEYSSSDSNDGDVAGSSQEYAWRRSTSSEGAHDQSEFYESSTTDSVSWSYAKKGQSAPASDVGQPSERISGKVAPQKKEGGLSVVLAYICALLGVASLVSAFLVFPVVDLPIDFVQTHVGTCAILGPPATLLCAIISWFSQNTNTPSQATHIGSIKRFRRTGLICAGLEYVYLTIWAWFL